MIIMMMMIVNKIVCFYFRFLLSFTYLFFYWIVLDIPKKNIEIFRSVSSTFIDWFEFDFLILFVCFFQNKTKAQVSENLKIMNFAFVLVFYSLCKINQTHQSVIDNILSMKMFFYYYHHYYLFYFFKKIINFIHSTDKFFFFFFSLVLVWIYYFWFYFSLNKDLAIFILLLLLFFFFLKLNKDFGFRSSFLALFNDFVIGFFFCLLNK